MTKSEHLAARLRGSPKTPPRERKRSPTSAVVAELGPLLRARDPAIQAIARARIEPVVREYRGNLSAVARALGVSERTIRRWRRTPVLDAILATIAEP